MAIPVDNMYDKCLMAISEVGEYADYFHDRTSELLGDKKFIEHISTHDPASEDVYSACGEFNKAIDTVRENYQNLLSEMVWELEDLSGNIESYVDYHDEDDY